MSRLPLNLQVLARQIREQEDESVRPKFLNKEERERLALERRENEEEERRRVQLEEQKARKQYLEGKLESERMIDSSELMLSPDEINLIKQRYIGGAVKKLKILKRHRDNKNLFDWDVEDDTGLPAAVHSLQGKDKKSEMDSIENITHWSKRGIGQMTDRDWRILKEDFSISTQGGSIPFPIRNWDETREINDSLQNVIQRLGYTNPTPIQRQAIPIALQKRDLIGIAETGSGKTLAFLIPILAYIQNLPPMDDRNALNGPYGLVLAPTRELALQIEQVAKNFCSYLNFKVIAIVGGHSLSEQSMQFRRGVEIIIATPGRLRDCLEQHVLALSQCYSVVLDEADRMIDMNFEEDLNFILNSLPLSNAKPDSDIAQDPSKLALNRYRQITMFSATMPAAVERLARLYLRRPAIVTIGEAGTVVDRIHQKIELITEHEKSSRLLAVLEQYDYPVIIFVNQKSTVDFLYNRLAALGYSALPLHGGKGQDQREHAISQLKSGSKDILIATDVASRGIDIKDVKLVLNYDMSKSTEDYIHRIGRTGRAGKEGTAITFLTEKDTDVYYDLRMLLQKSSNSSYPSDFSNHEAARQKPGVVQQKKRHEEKIFAFGV